MTAVRTARGWLTGHDPGLVALRKALRVTVAARPSSAEASPASDSDPASLTFGTSSPRSLATAMPRFT